MNANGQIAIAARWAARSIGMLLTGLIGLMIVGYGGPPNVFNQPIPIQLEFLAIALMVFGFIAGWRRELLGGLLVLAGFDLFLGVEQWANGKLPGGMLLLFPLPGILFLISFFLGTFRAAD